MPKQTPSQTVGPWFSYGLTPEAYGRVGVATNVLTSDQTSGTRIRLSGQVLDGAGRPVPDALIEIWQANAAGRYAHPADSRDLVPADPAFHGFGRIATGAEGRFAFDTIKPGRVPGPKGSQSNEAQAPHISMIVFARGLLSHLHTRVYFADEAEANAQDPILALVEPARRGTLIAERQDGHGGPAYRLDIHLQGPSETVFFDA